MSDFKSVKRSDLQRAFALAHRGSQDNSGSVLTRKRFRAIAKLIWDSCGEENAYDQAVMPREIIEQGGLTLEELEAPIPTHRATKGRPGVRSKETK
jgi:hypothetical protein